MRAVGRGGEASYAHKLPAECDILDIDDLSDAVSAREAADGMDAVIHTAGVFKKCEDMEDELVRPNILLAENMVAACAAANCRLVLTSSMAAVRGEGQPPQNAKHYTQFDWNVVSQRHGPGFAPYQYSKMASEQRAWELAREVGLELVTICPAMLFGPPRDPASTAFSVEMVRQWAKGDAAVKSTLVSDVRDVAAAHVEAAARPDAARKRFIVACEARSSASAEADAVREGLSSEKHAEEAGRARVHAAEGQQMGGGGGAVPIGDKEVDADAAETVLGVRCRPSAVALADMVGAMDL